MGHPKTGPRSFNEFSGFVGEQRQTTSFEEFDKGVEVEGEENF